MERRRFLKGLGGIVAFAGAAPPACKRTPRREEVLDALVREIVSTETAEVAARSSDLSAACSRFAEEPRAPELNAARAEWRRAAAAWKQGGAFRNGPLVDLNALARAAYWPVRAEAVEGLLRDARPVSAELVEQLGANVRGLYALEYLLFDQDRGMKALDRFSGADGARALALVRAYAESVLGYAGRVAAALGQAGQGFAATFAGGGQLSINTLVSQMVESVETLCESRLSTVLWMDKVKRLNAGDVEGWSSHTSTHLALSLLVGTDRLYVGGKSGGLADIVSGVAPDIDRRVRARFEAAIRAMRGLGAPIEAVVRHDRAKLEAAVKAVKELEIALKADLASALGVTLTFTSTDGD
jgi:uncharacterized protein